MIDDQYIINKFYIKDNRCGYRISGQATKNINEEEYNINYIEFYNIEECKSWINNYETKNN